MPPHPQIMVGAISRRQLEVVLGLDESILLTDDRWLQDSAKHVGTGWYTDIIQVPAPLALFPRVPLPRSPTRGGGRKFEASLRYTSASGGGWVTSHLAMACSQADQQMEWAGSYGDIRCAAGGAFAIRIVVGTPMSCLCLIVLVAG